MPIPDECVQKVSARTCPQSNLRFQYRFDESNVATLHGHPSSPADGMVVYTKRLPPAQIRHIAFIARSKLNNEASRSDWHLRSLVGNANFLDRLMIDLAEAERRRDENSNEIFGCASKGRGETHVRWLDQIPEEDQHGLDNLNLGSDGSDENVEPFKFVLHGDKA
jgi:hypothetical protein